MIKYKPSKQKKWAKQYGKSVRVGRKIYKLIFCEELQAEDGRELLGLCVYADQILYIVTSVPHAPAHETLVHEIFHAECFEAGFRQLSFWTPDLEELLCEASSRAMSAYELKKRRGT